jgi:hypothetical protein
LITTSFLVSAKANTGLSALGDMPWGTHFCLYYETKQDFLDTLICYFRAGLNNNEFCLWVLSDGEVTAEEAWSVLRQGIPDAEEHAAAGRLELISHDEWFLQGGNLEVPKVIKLLEEKYERALANGLFGMRLNGSTAWMQKTNAKDLQIFEQTLNSSLAGHRIIVMCNFPLETSKASEFWSVAHMHRFTISVREGVREIFETDHAPNQVT